MIVIPIKFVQQLRIIAPTGTVAMVVEAVVHKILTFYLAEADARHSSICTKMRRYKVCR
jgi:hypothetical protein